MIDFDAVNVSECYSKEVIISFFWLLVKAIKALNYLQ